MKTKNACILLLAALALTACDYDDSALWEQVNQNTEDIAAQAERIAALEAWQAETNIQSLQALLNTTDYITAVTPVMENGVEVGYTISFLNSDPVTIYHGQKGDKGDTGATPQIGVTQGEDGNWYWTLNGELLTDTEGNPIRANGEKGDPAPVPQLSTGSSLTTQGVAQDAEGTDIVADAIYLSVDGGNTWYRVSGEDGEQGDKGDKGDKGATGATGDSFFQSVDTTSDPTCVIFTLKNSDGTTTFSVPRYTGIKLTFDTQAVHLDYGNTLPVNFTAEGSDQFTAYNLFIIAPDGWKAEVTLPTRAATEFILNVAAPADAASGAAEGEILVMLDNQQGNTTIGRIMVDCKSTNLVMNNVTAGALATAIGNRTNLTSITVTSGTLNETDWAAVVKNNAALLYLDLAGATCEGTDKDNLIYNTTNATLAAISIKLPQGITTLGKNAFYGCLDLTTVTLPETLTSIGSYAFASCKALTSITLPDKVTSIMEYAFTSCTSLESIDLPEGLKSIGIGAFRDCTSLTSITLPDGLKSIGVGAFQNCYALTSIDLPEGVTTIGSNTFSQCSALKSIDLPEGLTSIGEYAFNSCKVLTSIDLPSTLESIGDNVFPGCYALTSITLPAGVTSIGKLAFWDCTSLTTVTCQATEVPDLGNNAFYGCSKLANIYVPAEAVGTYQAATGWSEYSTKIQPIQ